MHRTKLKDPPSTDRLLRSRVTAEADWSRINGGDVGKFPGYNIPRSGRVSHRWDSATPGLGTGGRSRDDKFPDTALGASRVWDAVEGEI
ncbi:hypothetical protein O1611_g1704 [Lasiodiplodia mahajangana]|uniref:Uncharacterized protein n=1 Tax=Lasiodiplodia mahajangana TaxID=1108764 RepID=A0ACC2JWL6_9PEZI|nr:hypothetical protein O1611_g1704 [Lasiodiplodia mahajangana]